MIILIYVPEKESYKCYVVQSEGVIRGYEKIPQNNITTNYRDYYINSNYIYKDGVATFSSYSTLPVCLSSDVVTSDVYYRNDLDSILIIFTILFFFCILIPWKIICRLFRRFN